MKLYSIIARAQGGQVFVNMGLAFGLSEELAAQVVRYFVAPIRKTIERRSESNKGLLSVLEILGSRHCDRYLSDPRMFGHPMVEEEGKRILSDVFLNPENINKVIANRARLLPATHAQLEAMFPYVAVMAIGAMEQRTRRPLEGVLRRITGGAETESTGNPYSELVTHLRRRDISFDRGAGSGRTMGLVGMLGALFSRSSAPRPAA